MKTNSIVFKSIATIVISLWMIIGYADDDLTLGQRTQHVVNAVGKAVSSVGDTLNSASKSVREYTDDSLITAKIKKALFIELLTNSFDISVTTRDGFVTLTGFITDPEVAIKAVQITTNVEGVKWVKDTLLIKTKPQRTIEEYISDIAITSEIKTGLLAKKGISLLSIQVETFEGIVHLSGYVDNSEQQFHAEEVAWRVEGVQGVKNDLLIKED